jgi:hypothetical protein
MKVICRTQGGQTHPDVCRSMKLSPHTVSTIMKNVDKIEHSTQPATTASAKQMSYSRRKLLLKTVETIVITGGRLQ